MFAVDDVMDIWETDEERQNKIYRNENKELDSVSELQELKKEFSYGCSAIVNNVDPYDTDKTLRRNARFVIMYNSICKELKSLEEKVLTKYLSAHENEARTLAKPISYLLSSFQQTLHNVRGTAAENITYYLARDFGFGIEERVKLKKEKRTVDMIIDSHNGIPLAEAHPTSIKTSKKDKNNDDADKTQLFVLGDIKQRDLEDFHKEKKNVIIIDLRGRREAQNVANELGLDVVIHDLDDGFNAVLE